MRERIKIEVWQNIGCFKIVKELFEIVSKDVGPVEHIRKSYQKKGYKMCKQSFYYMLRNKLYTETWLNFDK